MLIYLNCSPRLRSHFLCSAKSRLPIRLFVFSKITSSNSAFCVQQNHVFKSGKQIQIRSAEALFRWSTNVRSGTHRISSSAFERTCIWRYSGSAMSGKAPWDSLLGSGAVFGKIWEAILGSNLGSKFRFQISLCTSECVSGEANFEKSSKTRHKPLLLPSLCTSERVSGEANFEKMRKTIHKRWEAIWEGWRAFT